MSSIGVALSGGGHRAALFGLGVLLYLVDAGKNHDVGSIASVSGGSLTNGFVAQRLDYRTTSPEGFRQTIRPLARRLAKTGTVLPPSLVSAGYLVVVLVVVLALVGVWFAPSPLGWRLAGFVGALVVFGVVAGLRGLVVSRALARTLFSPEGHPTSLAEGNRSLDHVICAADLHAGENVYFSPGFVCSYRLGWGEPGDLPLHVAVQCSAALPGALPPRWLPTARHRFRSPRPEAVDATRIALVDGRVYDNMADQWTLGLQARRERWPALAKGLRRADEVIIVNASAGLEWSGIWPARIPLVGEIVALLRDKTILYDNGNAVRRELAVFRFGATGATGALVHIAQSPLRVARAFARGPDPTTATRAATIIDRLGPEEAAWAKIAETSSGLGTTLWGFGGSTGAELLRRGYALAMANLHVLLDYPLADVPDLAAFEELVA